MLNMRRQIAAEIPHLRRYARVLTGDPDAADDLLQDCLTRAWSRLHLWRRGSDLRRWLFTIMHNLHANARRRESSRPPTVMLEEIGYDPATRSSPVDPLHLRDLRNAFEQLSLEQRQVVFLVSVEGLTYQQVAEALELPLGTVMSRLHRARQKLREVLDSNESRRLRAVK